MGEATKPHCCLGSRDKFLVLPEASLLLLPNSRGERTGRCEAQQHRAVRAGRQPTFLRSPGGFDRVDDDVYMYL